MRHARPAAARKNEKKAAHEAKLDAGRRKRAVLDAEKRVADLDAEKVKLEAKFAKSDLYADPTAVITLQLELDRLRTESERALEAWERATEALEQLTT